MTTRRTTSLTLLTALALAGCDASMPWSSPKARSSQAQGAGPVTPASLTYKAWLHGPAPGPQKLHVPLLQPGMDVSFEVTPPAVVSGWYPAIGSAYFVMVPPDQVGVGTHQGFVTVEVRWPGRSAAGGPWKVPCTYVVGPPALDDLPATVQIDQLFGDPAPAVVPLHLTGAADAGPWSVEVMHGSTDHWLSVDQDRGAGAPATLMLSAAAQSGSASLNESQLRVTRAGQLEVVRVIRSARSPRLTASPSTVALTAVAGQAAGPAFSVAIGTESGVPASGSLSVEFDQAPDGTRPQWLTYDWRLHAPGTVPFQLSRTDLAQGHYTATITFWAGSEQVMVPVSLDVLRPMLSVTPASVQLSLTTANAAVGPSAQVSVSAVAEPVDFSVETAGTSLKVTPAAGSIAPGAPAVVTVALDPAGLGGWKLGSQTVTLQVRPVPPVPGDPVIAFPLSVTVQLDLPAPVGLGPWEAVTGSSAEIAVVGLGFSRPLDVRVGGAPAAAVRVLSDTELRVTPPSLPAGAHEFTVVNALGGPFRTGLFYRVSDPRPAGTAAVLPSAGRKARVFGDAGPEGGVIWSVNTGSGALEVFTASPASPGAWSREVVPAPGLRDAVMQAPPGTIFANAGGTIWRVTGGGLSGQPLALVDDAQAGQADNASSLAAPLDGHILVAAAPTACDMGTCISYSYDPLAHTLSSSGWDGELLADSRSRVRAVLGWRYATDTLILRPWEAGLSTYFGLGDWAPGGILVHGALVPRHLSVDLHGDTTLVVGDGTVSGGGGIVVDRAFQARPGRLPASTLAAVLTQDGARAIAFDGSVRKVRVYDLTSAPDPVTKAFRVAAEVVPLADPGAAPVLALTRDDRTLILAGDDRIVLVPLP